MAHFAVVGRRAWKVAGECLQSNVMHAQSYGASIYREKIQSFFSQIPATEYTALRNTLFGSFVATHASASLSLSVHYDVPSFFFSQVS